MLEAIKKGLVPLVMTVGLLWGECVEANATMYSDVINMTPSTTPVYWNNDDAPREAFITALISKMTLAEKIGQLDLQSGYRGETGPYVNAEYEAQIRSGHVGSVFNAYGAGFGAELQRIAVEETRLGIPLMIGHDIIHGHKTIFPQSIGEAASWDLDMVTLSARIAAKEASADGIMWTFAPMADIVRDPRWGRVSESAGEDPFLATAMSVARVKGFQGDDLSDKSTVLATAKHFVGYGLSEAGRDYNTTDLSQHELWSTHMPAFKAMVDSGVTSVMTAFNALNGIPATGNRYLLNDVLRGQWGFEGIVVTDYTAINELVPHGFASDNKHAAQLAFNAGADIDMVGRTYLNHLESLVAEGKVSEANIDRSVKRVLEMKWRLGLFEDPYRYHDPEREAKAILSPENLEASLQVARRSMVLLKNDNQILPLKRDQYKRIALIGPLAHNRADMIGNWAGAGDRETWPVTVKEGLQRLLEKDVELVYTQGATHAFRRQADLVELNKALGIPLMGDDDEALQQEIQRAVESAAQSDVVVLVLGESQFMSGEAASRTELTLPGNQQALLEALKPLGKPMVMIVMSGRPNDLQWANENVDAILHAWYPGTMGGQAVADVLLGHYNPSGKLPMTLPRSVGQVPLYYNHKSTGRPFDPKAENLRMEHYKSRYDDSLNTPLYAFGHGLSYTQFEYGRPRLSQTSLSENASLTVSIDVTNTGRYAGEEVIQLYTRQKVGSVTRPVKELKGFQKLYFSPNQTRTVSFTLTPADLAFYRADMTWGTESGEFELFVGSASDKVQSTSFTLE